MRALAVTLGVGLLVGACAHAPTIDLSSAGAAPEPGAAWRFAGQDQGQDQGARERPADFPGRSEVEAGLARKGLRRSDGAPRYLVEASVTARPLNVGAFTGPAAQPAWLAAPAGKRDRGRNRVCAVALRFVDAATGAEAYRVRALQHGKVPDCASQTARLVDAALAGLPSGR